MKIKNFLTALNNRGVAAVMAVFILILFSLLGLVICPLFSTQSAGKVNFLQSQQALQIAEAGRQYAVWYLDTQDNYWTTDWTPEQTLGKGTWRVKVESDTEIIVTSKGYVPQESNFLAQRVVKTEGIYDIKAGTHPIYNYALYTDSQDVIADSPLVFDANDYTLYTTEDNDGDADVHSNETITFLNGSGQVIDGSVYSANQIDASGWAGTPWRDADYPDTDIVLSPYMGEETKDYYRQRAQAQGNYDAGDTTITGDLELNSIRSSEATLIFAEGNVTIGNVIYRGPSFGGSRYWAGVGTIVAGGKMIINGYIKPHPDIWGGSLKDRCALALVSFGDVSYEKTEEPDYPPFYEGARELHIKEGGVSSTAEKIEFSNSEQCTISYVRESGWRENRRRGYITAGTYNNPTIVYNHVPMDKRNIGGGKREYYITFNTSALPSNEWCYFYVEIEHDILGLEHRSGAWMIVGTSAPEHGIWTYKDNTFLESSKTVAFSNGDIVYLEVYADDPSTANFNQIEVNNYTTLNPPNLPRTGEDEGTDSIRCRFTLPASTEDWWYNLKVTTTEGYTFRKQIYIIPAGAVVDVYSCIYADDKFRVPESSSLKITGNLAARRGLTLATDSPLTDLEIEKDTEAFRGELPWQVNDPDAVPGAVSFSYTWKEVKD